MLTVGLLRCALPFAGDKGYNGMGVEYAEEGYCNQEGPISGAVAAPNGDNECNMLCKGDNREFCDAGDRLNVL